MDDLPVVLAYHSDPLYQRYYAPSETTQEQSRKLVKMFIEQQHEQPRRKFQLAATLKTNHVLIGNCGIRMDTPDAHQADIGYEFVPEYWGNGYATEAAKAIVQFGFSTLGVHRIWTWINADNRGSRRVLEKLGMLLEGRLRENEFFKGRYWDTLMFGILEPEWQALKQKEETEEQEK